MTPTQFKWAIKRLGMSERDAVVPRGLRAARAATCLARP